MIAFLSTGLGRWQGWTTRNSILSFDGSGFCGPGPASALRLVRHEGLLNPDGERQLGLARQNVLPGAMERHRGRRAAAFDVGHGCRLGRSGNFPNGVHDVPITYTELMSVHPIAGK